MLYAIMILFALQIPVPGPRSGTDALPISAGNCSIQELDGQLVFPAFVAPAHFVDVELHPLASYASTKSTFTGPDETFHFYGLGSGAYDIDIRIPGMDIVHQFVVLLRDTCLPSPGAHIIIPLHISPAIKPSPIDEDAVSIKNLVRKTPGKVTDSFEKVMDKESKTDSVQTSAALLEILKTTPDYYDATLELGLEYKKENEPADSAQMLSHALEINSGSMLARSTLGQYRFEAGDFREAARLLGEAVRLGNTSADVYFMLGTSYYKLGEMETAEASLVRALDIDPSIGKAHLQLYNVYMKEGMPTKALAEVTTYLTDYPEAKDREYVQSFVDKQTSPAVTNPEPAAPKVLTQKAEGMAPDLAAVINRATEYVTKYEAELGNLIGTEEYLQTAIWPGLGIPMVSKNGAVSAIPAKTVTRRISSDFLLIKVGPNWVGLREANTVDGARIKNDQPQLDTAFDDSPANNARHLISLKADNTKYNIGDIVREYNLPTFALQVLRADQFSRFSFEKDGTDKIGGTVLWRVKFRELTGPALVVSVHSGKDLYSTGTIWVEPETGKVLKTEFLVENREVNPAISSSVIVTYSPDKARDILVPSQMAEHYETAGNIIDCRAEYSKFHPFTVDVKFDFNPVRPAP